MMDLSFSLTDPTIWVSLVTLTVMEVILGIDNIIFISLFVSKLPKAKAEFARKLGLFLAFLFRILMLLTISWIIQLKQPLFSLFGQSFSWRDIILCAGGLFLLAKATHEIHNDVEDVPNDKTVLSDTFTIILIQIILIDIVFSIDSIITAIGMVEHVEIMIAAVTISMAVMYFASVSISQFIENHPTTKILALSFLLLIGAALIADGFHFHIPRAYIYFAMAFAAFIEVLHIWRRSKRKSLTNIEN